MIGAGNVLVEVEVYRALLWLSSCFKRLILIMRNRLLLILQFLDRNHVLDIGIDVLKLAAACENLVYDFAERGLVVALTFQMRCSLILDFH